MAKKIMNIFSRNPLIWFHYILLTGVLFAAFYLGETYLSLSDLSIQKIFIFWFLVLSITDQLIHSKYILNVD